MTRYNRGWVVDPHTGAIIDPETGIVLEDSPVSLEPEYRAYDYDELVAREHYTPVEKPPEPTKREQLETIVRMGGLPEDAEDVKLVREQLGGYLLLGESQAIAMCGIRCLGVFRVLRRVYGLSPLVALDALQEAVHGERTRAPRKAVRGARELLEAWEDAVRDTLLRLAATTSRPIDLDAASKLLRVRVSSGAVRYIIVEYSGVKIQVTRRKLEAPARLYNIRRAVDAIRRLAARLGVEIRGPEPKVATTTLRLPFRVFIHAVPEGRHERLIVLDQGDRLKILDEGDEFTALVYPQTINIYLRRIHRDIRRQLDRIILRLLTLTANYSYAD